MRYALTLAILVGLPNGARAFDDFEDFAMPIFPEPPTPPDPPAPPGGGGGRYFTGSLSDGYSCAVCHYGGEAREVDVTVEPDPFTDGYRAGTEYEIVIQLPVEGIHSATLELVDLAGNGAGTLALIPVSAQSTTFEQCFAVRPEDPIAAHLDELTDPPRQVAGLDACGASRMRAIWTAPAVTTGPVWLNAAMVTSDQDGTPAGDDTVVYGRVIPPFGQTADAGRVDTGCRVSPGGTRPALAWVALLFAVALVSRLRTGTRP